MIPEACKQLAEVDFAISGFEAFGLALPNHPGGSSVPQSGPSGSGGAGSGFAGGCLSL